MQPSIAPAAPAGSELPKPVYVLSAAMLASLPSTHAASPARSFSYHPSSPASKTSVENSKLSLVHAVTATVTVAPSRAPSGSVATTASFTACANSSAETSCIAAAESVV